MCGYLRDRSPFESACRSNRPERYGWTTDLPVGLYLSVGVHPWGVVAPPSPSGTDSRPRNSPPLRNEPPPTLRAACLSPDRLASNTRTRPRGSRTYPYQGCVG